MHINITDVPQEVIDEYKLYENNYVLNGCVYVKIWQAFFGLKQSGALANKQLSKVLGTEGYFHSEHTSGLWLHKTRDIYNSHKWSMTFASQVYRQGRCPTSESSH
jgi:hypothetical protein